MSTETSTETPTYQAGDRVERLEDREVTAATVIRVQQVGNDVIVEIEYDEGGSGWWPATSIRPLAST
jgi:hypothetical protein